MDGKRLLLVGDNPFHGISHLSQARAASRGDEVTSPERGAGLVSTALDSGADGFMFSASETTLAILRKVVRDRKPEGLRVYVIVPYAYEYVRMAVLAGGVPGLARGVGRQIVMSGNWRAITNGMRGVLANDPSSLLKSYLSLEVARIRSAAGGKCVLASIMLHELLTDMALALDMKWVVETHIRYMSDRRIKPGFETRNLPYLVRKFEEWGIDPRGVTLAASFNPVGFQMCPSRESCEEALRRIDGAEVIAFSILAAGYVKPAEAAEYLSRLPFLSGVAVGVSKAEQARQTFPLLRGAL
jgi:hypothetical protein